MENAKEHEKNALPLVVVGGSNMVAAARRWTEPTRTTLAAKRRMPTSVRASLGMSRLEIEKFRMAASKILKVQAQTSLLKGVQWLGRSGAGLLADVVPSSRNVLLV